MTIPYRGPFRELRSPLPSAMCVAVVDAVVHQANPTSPRSSPGGPGLGDKHEAQRAMGQTCAHDLVSDRIPVGYYISVLTPIEYHPFAAFADVMSALVVPLMDVITFAGVLRSPPS